MKKTLAIVILCFSTSFSSKMTAQVENIKHSEPNSEKVKVLNFATFHMRNTTDANKVEFNEKDKKNQSDAKRVAEMIAKFKPTIICLEIPPEQEVELNVAYQKYLKDPEVGDAYSGEIRLIAFEVGKIANTSKLYAIDHKMAYNYNITREVNNSIDPETINEFYSNPFKFYPSLNVDEKSLSLLDRMRLGNTQECLDFLMNINADLLTHVGTEGEFEGADEAAKFYHRNLRIYANLNRIETTKDDRIFILTGGTHAAFLGEFMKRSPKYEVVNTLDYLD